MAPPPEPSPDPAAMPSQSGACPAARAIAGPGAAGQAPLYGSRHLLEWPVLLRQAGRDAGLA